MTLKLHDKVVLITGASSGIGKASAMKFAENGANLILVARRQNKLDELATYISKTFNNDVLTIKLDVRNKEEVLSSIHNLPKEWNKIDILINNAGLALSTDKIQDAKLENWEIMIDTNLRGLLYVTYAILPSMTARNSGHIINIGSCAGHEYYPSGNIYSATKHAVKAISKSLRLDLLGTAIRVTEIAPGAVETEFSEVRWKDKKRAKEFYKGFHPLEPDDIADAIVYCATRPLHVDISEISIFPTAQASANHLYREGQKTENIFD